jgi:hypothetical protein
MEVETIMRLKATIFAVVAGLLFAATALAQGTGRSLDIQPGGRENGMGGAGVALGDEPTGMTWWNPAALGFAKTPAIQLTSCKLVPGLADDVSYNQVGYVQPLEGWGGIAVSLAFLSYGSSMQVNEQGTELGTFDSYEASSGLSYGTQLLPDLAIGASIKYIHIQLAPSNLQGVASAFGFDLGALYKLEPARLRFGMNIQNLGPSVVFINEDQASPLSRNLKVGAAWDPLPLGAFGVTFASDFNHSLVTSDFNVWNSGMEVRYGANGPGMLEKIGIAGRIGWYSDPLGDIKGLTYGVGFTWSKLALDYGSIPQAKDSGLPNVNKISLGWRF